MAKIVRYNGNLVPFASASLGTERTVFGDVTQADDITSQYTAEFLRGWGIVGPSDQPTLQDFNAVSYTHGQILSYIHQMGIPEYNAAQEYPLGGLCNVDGVIYSSKVNSNIGNTPASSPTQWRDLSISTDGIPSSHSNLKVTTTGLSALVSITAASVCVKDSTAQQKVLNSVSVTPNLAASGVNGLDTGVSAISTWYSIWVIWNGTTVAGLLSLSTTAPTMPAGYTYKARVGWIRTDATGNKYPLCIAQNGDEVTLNITTGTNTVTPVALATGIIGNPSAGTYIPTSVSSAVPPTARTIEVYAFAYAAAAAYGVSNSNGYSSVGSTNPPPIAYTAPSVAANVDFVKSAFSFVLASTNLHVAANTADFVLRAIGWRDNL